MKYLARVTSIISLIYICVVLSAYLLQRHLVYYPAVERVHPASLGLTEIMETELNTPDGERLVGWYGKAQPGRPTILYFHGNAGNLADRASRVRLYRRHGLGVMMVAYRGFSGSTGTPSEAVIIKDALAVFDTLIGMGVKSKDIVIYGESLGTGVAVQVAAERMARALVLEAPFNSAVAIGAHVYPYLPVYRLSENRFESDRHIGRVAMPILFLLAAEDEVVPARFGAELFAAAPAPKTKLELAGATHYTIYEHGGFEAVARFIGVPLMADAVQAAIMDVFAPRLRAARDAALARLAARETTGSIATMPQLYQARFTPDTGTADWLVP